MRKIISGRQVDELFNWSRWTRARREKAGCFPKRVNLIPGRDDYFEDEILAFQEELAASRNQAAA